MFPEPKPIGFSLWVPWHDRVTLTSHDGQPSLGVYIWAHFHGTAVPSVPPYPALPEEVIYVGETKNVNQRPLRQAHQRIAHYRDTYPADRDLRLYVSVFHVECFRRDDPRCRALRAFTRYVEDLLYWDYVKRFGRRAALDYKKGHDGEVVSSCCAAEGS